MARSILIEAELLRRRTDDGVQLFDYCRSGFHLTLKAKAELAEAATDAGIQSLARQAVRHTSSTAPAV